MADDPSPPEPPHYHTGTRISDAPEIVPDVRPVTVGPLLADWTRVIINILLLVLFGVTIAFGCWQTHVILKQPGLSVAERREEINIVKDLVSIAIDPIAALLGTAVAVFHIKHR
jgi:hypothetical protein